MKLLTVQQGSPEWAAIRAKHNCASEAPIVMGVSKFASRSDLLRQKSTGLVPEVDAHKQALFDRGHEAERTARVIVEEMIGEDLSPITAICEETNLLASLDGATLMGDILFEHKLWSESLAAQVRAGELEPHYYWQLEQQLLVADAEVVVFVTSDGTREKFVSMEYRPVAGRREHLIAAWKQFDIDLAAYKPPAAAEVVHATPIEALPAVSVQMQGSLTVHSNLDVFGKMLREFIGKIPAKPSSEQEFADCDAACKALKRAEEALDGAEANALGQVQSVEQITRTIADLRTVARTARLASEKMVKARKEQIRTEEVQRGKDALLAFLVDLNLKLGHPLMPAITADFAGAISGKKTVDSVRNAIDTELAKAKIAANEVFAGIVANQATLRELASNYRFLFADTAQIVLKAPDDCRALVQLRIAEHKAAEEKKEADQRERIRAEEAENLRQAEAEKNRMRLSEISGIRQQVIIASVGRAGVRKGGTIECIRETLAETEAWVIEEANFGPLTSTAQSAKDDAVAKIRALLTEAEARAAQPPAAAPASAPIAAPAPVAAPQAAAANASTVVPIRAAVDNRPPIKLGDISERLGFQVTAAFLAQLGFQPVTRERTSVLYRPADFNLICEALVAHLRTVAEIYSERAHALTA